MPPPHTPRVFGALEHYNYPQLDQQCICLICHDWRTTFRTWRSAPRNFKLRSAYLAANNRRDLYCECSWHAKFSDEMFPEIVGQQFMIWIRRIIDDRNERGDCWWEGRAPYLTLAFWMFLYRKSFFLSPDTLAGLLSGTNVVPAGMDPQLVCARNIAEELGSEAILA